MSTFAELSMIVRRSTGNIGIDVAQVLREGENEFIKETKITEQTASVTTDENFFTLPADYLRAIRIEWNDTPLVPAPKNAYVDLRDAGGSLITGTPTYYWISDGGVQLLPSPTESGIITLLYIRFNNDTDSASPIIHSQWHSSLVYYAVKEILGYKEDLKVSDEKKILRNEKKWNESIQNAKTVRLIDQIESMDDMEDSAMRQTDPLSGYDGYSQLSV